MYCHWFQKSFMCKEDNVGKTFSSDSWSIWNCIARHHWNTAILVFAISIRRSIHRLISTNYISLFYFCCCCLRLALQWTKLLLSGLISHFILMERFLLFQAQGAWSQVRLLITAQNNHKEGWELILPALWSDSNFHCHS